MTVDAGELHCFCGVHGGFIGCGVAGNAAGGSLIGFRLGLIEK
jgi:hypothetical protein